MEDNNNSSFMDKNTIIAILLSTVFFIGWQFYMQKKYPNRNENKVAVEQTSESTSDQEQTTESSTEQKQIESEITAEKVSFEEQTFEIKTDSFNAQLSSAGMGLKAIQLNKFTDRKDKNIEFINPTLEFGNFSTLYKGKVLPFQVSQQAENHFVGTARVGEAVLQKEIKVFPQSYTFEVSVKVLSGQLPKDETIQTHLSNKVLKVKSSMFRPAYEGTEYFTINDGDEERERIEIDSNYSQGYPKVSLASIGTQYFALAVKDKSPFIPSVQLDYDAAEQVAYAKLAYPVSAMQSGSAIQFTGFVGPKKYDILKGLDPQFVQMINYGMFSALSKPFLSVLKWLYGIFKNWGVAIILLTLFIKILLLPINISSLRSMKKMQKIQPQLKAIKEKYKNDPQRVNQETMALMKKEKANPLGGCLPMLLQIPVFLALYSVIGQSVELYKSPFIFWIQDLSYQDPFFVLPISVGLLYFLQMNLFPQPTMDPTQAKVMKFIPLLFCFFMITVPSGLTLYFFVNTVFGIGQQFIFQKEKRKVAA